MNMTSLTNQPRLVLEAPLVPIAGTRFQPTGFPDLGAAQYKTPDGVDMILVESAQSMANRLEDVCWDKNGNDWVPPLKGLPCVVVKDEDGTEIINSVLASHRLNSPYIIESEDKSFKETLQKELDIKELHPVDLGKLARTLFKYDVNSLIHGIFLAKSDIAGGRMRLPRALTSFVEARNVTSAASGGVKLDAINPSGDTSKGFGNVPFHREEFCGEIKASFVLDLSLIRGFGLGTAAENLLISLSLFKILRFLHQGLRLRTACDLMIDGAIDVVRPTSFDIPSVEEIENTIPDMINKAKEGFASPPRTVVKYIPKSGKKSKS